MVDASARVGHPASNFVITALPLSLPLSSGAAPAQVPAVSASASTPQPQDHTDLSAVEAVAGAFGGTIGMLLCLIALFFNIRRLARVWHIRPRAKTSNVLVIPAESSDTRRLSVTSLLTPVANISARGSLISTRRESTAPSEEVREMRQSVSNATYGSKLGEASDAEAECEDEEEIRSNDTPDLQHQRPDSLQTTTVVSGRNSSVVGDASVGGLSRVSGVTDAPPPYASANAAVFDINEIERARLAIERYNNSAVHL